MTTTRERALEAALLKVKHYVEHFKHYGAPPAVEIARSRLAEIDAALALPSSQPETPPVAAGEHTPGPWHIDAHKTTNAFIWGADTSRRGCIAQVNLIAPDDTKAEGNANARLISAAPDMLAALQRLADVVEGGHYRNPIDLTTELDQARAAIARATGREG